jgi:hypothetical protein
MTPIALPYLELQIVVFQLCPNHHGSVDMGTDWNRFDIAADTLKAAKSLTVGGVVVARIEIAEQGHVGIELQRVVALGLVGRGGCGTMHSKKRGANDILRTIMSRFSAVGKPSQTLRS